MDIDFAAGYSFKRYAVNEVTGQPDDYEPYENTFCGDYSDVVQWCEEQAQQGLVAILLQSVDVCMPTNFTWKSEED